ncbi:MAG: MFS transporter [Chloroflexota bacterium]
MHLRLLAMPRFGRVPRFTRETRLLMAVAATFALSFYGVHALLRLLYIIRLGFGPAYLGWYNASGALAYMSMSVPAGALGARYGTARMMRVGAVVTVAGFFLTPLAEFVPGGLRAAWPIASQVFLTAGWCLLNVNLVPALMAITTPENRSNTYAWMGVMRGVGTFAGTMIGGLLPGLYGAWLGVPLSLPAPYRLALWTGGALGVVGLAPVFRLPLLRGGAARAAGARAGSFPVRAVALIVVFVLVSHGGWATCQAFFNPYADQDLRLSTATLGLISGVGQVVAVAAPLALPALARRRGNGWALLVSTLGIGLSLALLGLVPHWAAAGLGRLGVQSLEAIWLPALQVFQMELVDEAWRSLAYGVASTAMGLAYALVSLLGGYVSATAGYRTVFLLGIGLCAAGVAVMGVMLRTTRPRRS